MPLPAYTEYRQAFPSAGVGPPGHHHDLDLVVDLLSAGRVVLLSNPHNPSGRALAACELAAAARAAPSGVLVVDESYVEFAPDPRRDTLVGRVGAGVENLLVLRSPSKFFGLAGARVGVAWAPSPALRAAMSPPQGSWPVSALEVIPAVAALADRAWAAASHAALRDDAAWLEAAVGLLGRPVTGSVTHFRLVPARRCRHAGRPAGGDRPGRADRRTGARAARPGRAHRRPPGRRAGRGGRPPASGPTRGRTGLNGERLTAGEPA